MFILAGTAVFHVSYGKRANDLGLVDGVVRPNSDTVALWLFDEFEYPQTTLTDASVSAKADLRLLDGGKMASGRYGRALRVTGAGYAVVYAGFSGKVPQEEMRGPDGAPSGLWGPTEGSAALLDGLAGDRWTIEFWLDPLSAIDGSTIIDLGQSYDPGFSLEYNKEAFVITNHYAGVKANCPAKLSVGVWHHVAFTGVGGKIIAHYLNGVRRSGVEIASISRHPPPDLQKPEDREHESRGVENMTAEERRLNRFNLAIGTDRRGGNAMRGMVDELRVSKVARYDGNFTPKSFSRNFGESNSKPAEANGPALLFDPDPVSIPLEFGARKYVFIDDAIVDEKENVRITMNRPYGKEPLKLDFKVEKSAWRPSVFDVSSEIFMAIPEGYSSNEGLTLLATSGDGISFNIKGKIIPQTPIYGAFFKDLNPSVLPEHLYKVNAYIANRGMYFFTSPDGLNWRRNETIQLPLVSGGGGECFWDDQRGVYLSLIKRDSSFNTEEHPGIGPRGHKAVVFESREIFKPWPFRPVANPWYEGWPFPSVTGEGKTLLTAQEYGWVYRSRAIKYPWAPDVYLAFIWRYPGDDGARHVELAVSRNGREWQLFGTHWYFPTGAADEEICIYGLLRRGDEIWQYANEGAAHGGDGERTYSRYTQRLDGFASLDAGDLPGTATTLPLVFQGDRLVLNLEAKGGVKVAITDEKGRALPGYGFEDCDSVTGDFVEKIVTWKGSPDIGALAGRSVRLEFQMQDAKLYAFEFAADVPQAR